MSITFAGRPMPQKTCSIMTYAMSDLHGRYEKYEQMLSKIGFGDADTLYLIGDLIDRGPDSGWILMDLLTRGNVIPMLGNHEWMLLQAYENPSLRSLWFRNGAIATLESLETVQLDLQQIVDWMKGWPVAYTAIRVRSQNFYLTHACPIYTDKPVVHTNDLTLEELENVLWFRYLPQSAYLFESYISLLQSSFPDTIFITGHSPTYKYHAPQSESPNYYKIYRYPNTPVLDIDCGCGQDQTLACLCLDTLQEWYLY